MDLQTGAVLGFLKSGLQDSKSIDVSFFRIASISLVQQLSPHPLRIYLQRASDCSHSLAGKRIVLPSENFGYLSKDISKLITSFLQSVGWQIIESFGRHGCGIASGEKLRQLVQYNDNRWRDEERTYAMGTSRRESVP